MELNFKPLGEVELLEKPPKDANVLVEVGGKIKRAPAKLTGGNVGVSGGGNGGIYTLDLSSYIGESLDGSEIVVSLQEAQNIINGVKASSGLAVKALIASEEITSSMPLEGGIMQCLIVAFIVNKNQQTGEIISRIMYGVGTLGNDIVPIMIAADYEVNQGIIAFEL